MNTREEFPFPVLDKVLNGITLLIKLAIAGLMWLVQLLIAFIIAVPLILLIGTLWVIGLIMDFVVIAYAFDFVWR